MIKTAPNFRIDLLASFSETFGTVFSVSARDFVISSSKASASSYFATHVVASVTASLLSFMSSFWRLFTAKSSSVSVSSDKKPSPAVRGFHLRADSAYTGP